MPSHGIGPELVQYLEASALVVDSFQRAIQWKHPNLRSSASSSVPTGSPAYRLRQIKAVEREYLILRSAIDRLLAESDGRAAAGVRAVAWRLGDVRQAAEHLEGTYIIRLFAEFETGLRRFWQAKRRADPPARTRDLMEGVAAMRRIPPAHCQDAHEVRDYRKTR